MPVFTQGPLAGPALVEGALPCWASTVPEGPALQENCPVFPAAASLTSHTHQLIAIAVGCHNSRAGKLLPHWEGASVLSQGSI